MTTSTTTPGTGAAAVLQELQRLGVTLEVTAGGTIRATPGSAVPVALVTRIREHKAALLELLRRGGDAPQSGGAPDKTPRGWSPRPRAPPP